MLLSPKAIKKGNCTFIRRKVSFSKLALLSTGVALVRCKKKRKTCRLAPVSQRSGFFIDVSAYYYYLMLAPLGREVEGENRLFSWVEVAVC